MEFPADPALQEVHFARPSIDELTKDMPSGKRRKFIDEERINESYSGRFKVAGITAKAKALQPANLREETSREAMALPINYNAPPEKYSWPRPLAPASTSRFNGKSAGNGLPLLRVRPATAANRIPLHPPQAGEGWSVI